MCLDICFADTHKGYNFYPKFQKKMEKNENFYIKFSDSFSDTSFTDLVKNPREIDYNLFCKYLAFYKTGYYGIQLINDAGILETDTQDIQLVCLELKFKRKDNGDLIDARLFLEKNKFFMEFLSFIDENFKRSPKNHFYSKKLKIQKLNFYIQKLYQDIKNVVNHD